MSQDTRYFKLGLFIIVSFALCAAFLIAFGASRFFKQEVLVETCFNETIQGLNVGSPVKYKGIPIGSVKSIDSAAKIYREATGYIHVIMAMSDDVFLGQTGEDTAQRITRAVENGLSIHLSFMGLTGAAFLETDYARQGDFDPLEINWTPRHLYIPSRPSNIKRFTETLNHIMDSLDTINIQGIVTDLQMLLSTLNTKANHLDVKQISAQAQSLAAEVRETNLALKRWLESDELRQLISKAAASVAQLNTILEKADAPIENTLADFEQTARTTRRMTRSFEQKVTAEAKTISDDLADLTASLQRTADMIENTVWVNSTQIGTMIENLKTTSQNLKYMSMELKQYPGKLIFDSPEPRIIPKEP